jgi:hypothetical protein
MNFTLALAAALAIAVPALGTAWAQGRIGPAASAALAEKPELSTTAIVLAVAAGHERLAGEQVPGMPVGFTVGARDGSVDIDDTLAARLARSRRRVSVDVVAKVLR